MKESTKNVGVPCTPGERLKESRKKQHLTQAELAERVGKLQREKREENEEGGRECSEKSISMFENGRPFSRNYAYLFSMVLGVRQEYLLCESDFPTVKHEFSATLNEMNEEARLLHSGFVPFASLNGYTVTTRELTGSIEHVFHNLRSMYSIEKDGKTVSLSIEEMNRLENELAEMIGTRLKYLFEERCK